MALLLALYCLYADLCAALDHACVPARQPASATLPAACYDFASTFEKGRETSSPIGPLY